MEAPGFWDDPERSNQKMKELKNLKDTVGECDKLSTQFDDILTLIDMGYEENDASLIPEIREELDEFIREFDELRIGTLLSGEYDKNNAILKLNAGAGGTESCDWCGMLYRMYTRWAERKGFAIEVLDYLDGDEAGIKSVTFQVNGLNAYGYLKSEKGVHRLVRISPFNAQGKRQTSFVSLDVMPDIEGDLDVDIDEKDLRIDTYRSSGAGGQHINKTSSAIRITHIPTGTVVQCQNERSQFQNKDKAMQMLKAKLYLLKQEANAEKLSDIRGEVKEIGWGNQIRSYVLQPYTLVKDHRTDVETGNVDAVLDGLSDGKFSFSYPAEDWEVWEQVTTDYHPLTIFYKGTADDGSTSISVAENDTVVTQLKPELLQVMLDGLKEQAPYMVIKESEMRSMEGTPVFYLEDNMSLTQEGLDMMVDTGAWTEETIEAMGGREALLSNNIASDQIQIYQLKNGKIYVYTGNYTDDAQKDMVLDTITVIAQTIKSTGN